MKNIIEVGHPLAKHKLSKLRDKKTSPTDFRRLVSELADFLVIEALSNLKTTTIEIETPIAKTKGEMVEEPVTFVPIMRAGMALLDGALRLVPFASVGHIGIYRDKMLKNTVEYFFRMPPKVENSRILVLDPMLATGDTAIAALARLKEHKTGPIDLLCLLAAKPGIEKLHKEHPDVRIITVSIEPELNDKDYVVPGIGDAGDRIYGTTL